MSDELRKVTMAGIGMTSTAVEKAKKTINKYAKKGEDYVNQDNTLGYKMKNAVEDMKEKTDDAIDYVKNKIDNCK